MKTYFKITVLLQNKTFITITVATMSSSVFYWISKEYI